MSRLASLLIILSACGGASDAPGLDAAVADSGAVDVPGSTLPLDPCGGMVAACPTLPAGYTRGSGLRALDRCSFPMTDRDQWADRGAVIDAFPAAVARVTLADIASDLNRAATRVTAAQLAGSPPGVTTAFAWQAGDEAVTYWIPQGITGSFDGRDDGLVAGRKLLLVSWYYEIANEPGSTTDKGVRIAIVDVTNPAAVSYRFALLAEPVMANGRADFAPVKVHAGGLAWVGDLLYVPVTGSGFRVFDLSRILRVDGLADRLGYDPGTGGYDAHGYRYVIPQVGEYVDASACEVRFSYVALDRSTTPPSLVSGEYDAASIGGRLVRWPLDPATGRLVMTDAGRTVADAAWYSGETHVQGGISRNDTFWLSSSRPAAGAGELKRTRVDQPSQVLGWIDSPEDLAFDPQGNQMWSLSELVNERYVFASALGAID